MHVLRVSPLIALAWTVLAIPCALAARAARAFPTVVGVDPAPQTISADPPTTIFVQFDRAIDPLTVNAQTMRVFGRWSGPASGQYSCHGLSGLVRFIPDEQFFAGEWVTVALSNGVRDTDGNPLPNGYAWNFWIRTLHGTLDVTEIARIPIRLSGETHIQSYGAYAGDLNDDGWSDLAIPNEQTNDVRVFLHDQITGYNAFTVFGLPGGSVPSTNEGADFNGDGRIDIAVGNGGNDQLTVMLGDGLGGFPTINSYTAGNLVRGLGVCDLDADGDDDIVTANRSGNNLSLFFNNGNGTFAAAVAKEAGGSGETSCAIADANNDGILDVFVGTFTSLEIILLLGDGNGGLAFSDRVTVGGRAWMLAVGDVNNDGDVDVVSANSFANTASVVFGDGQGGLSAPDTYASGFFPLAIDLGDIDGDGDLDMITSNYSSADWKLWENDGTGTFVNPRTLQASEAGSCATLHDRDNDGDLDITGIDELSDLLFIFDNSPDATAVPPPAHTFRFLPGFPNPFNPLTTLRFDLPHSATVSIRIYNIMGDEVATVLSERRPAGRNTVGWDASSLPSGIYVARLRAGLFEQARKLVLLK